MDRRSCWSLTLCLLVLLIMGFLGYMHFKRELINKLISEVDFSEQAVREADQGVENYEITVENTQVELERVDKEVKGLEDEIGKLNSAKQQKDTQLKTCSESLGGLNNDIAAVEKEKTETDATFAGDKTNWSGVIDELKKKFQEKSPVCAHVPKEKFELHLGLKDILELCQTASQA